MIDTLKAAWRLPDLRKKILFTFFMLIVFRLGSYIPVPGLQPGFLGELLNESEQLTGQFDMFTIMNMFAGGALSQGSIFAMGVSPYINSSIIMQLLTVAIPALERMQKEGEEGRKKIQSITRIVTIALALIQGIGIYFLLNQYKMTINPVKFLDGFIVVATLTAGTAFVMWLGEQITDKGIGNGISLIIFIGIVSSIPSVIESVIRTFVNKTDWWIALIILIYAIAMVAFVVYFDSSERRIPVQYSKRVVGRKMYGGQSTYIPLKVAMAGVLPIIFAISILSFPTTIIQLVYRTSDVTQLTGWAGFVTSMLSPSSWVYCLIYFLLIIAFTYFYTSISFNPIEISNNMKKNGGFIPGIRPGKPTSDFISKVLSRINLSGALFLGIVAVLPLVIGIINSDFSALSMVGGSSVLILVGVALETVKQIEAQMMMRHYKGFLD